jgi:hypothetical protein
MCKHYFIIHLPKPAEINIQALTGIRVDPQTFRKPTEFNHLGTS